MNTRIKALVLEDVPMDAELLGTKLTDGGFEVSMDVVDTEAEFVSRLKEGSYDVIFVDFTLPAFHGDQALALARQHCPQVPLIFVSGTIGEDQAVELLKQGATDYVLKHRMERVTFATRRALEAADNLKKFRRKEVELKTNRKLLQTILNNAPDIIFVKGADGKFLLVNDAHCKAMGTRIQDVVGKDESAFHQPEECAVIQETDLKVRQTGMPLSFEHQVRHADGTLHTYEAVKCPFFDEEGKYAGLFGISRDITERKRMEHILTDARDKAEAADRLKTAFLHNISHEVRTPMNAIIGFSGLINDPSLSPDRREEFTGIIVQSCYQLLSIITDIVSIASLEARQEEVQNASFSLRSCLNALQEQFRLRAESKGLSVALDLPVSGALESIVSDEPKLVQILSKLLENAVKFTPSGSIRFGYEIKGSDIEFFVRDTGIGVPPEMHQDIFERFRQVESSLSRQYGGSGLGLSIARAYAELLGGRIWLTSEPGQGSVFYFTIPLVLPDESTCPEAAADLPNSRTGGKTIHLLVAEDEESNFLLLQELLDAEPIRITRAVTGVEAVEICRTQPVDAVLMDIKMPVMDGYEATRQITALCPGIPVIAQSAYVSDADRVKALGCGCVDYLTKPIRKEALLSRIRVYLR
jgi:PAS domain S-box-containing protein